jgi:uncharacterized protein YcfJ
MTDLEDVLSQYYSSDNLVVFKSDCDSILELALNLSDEVEAVTCAVGVSVAKNSAIYWDVVSPANHWGLTDPTPVSIGKSATRIAVSDSELRQQCIDADIAGAVTGAAIGAVVGIATGPGVIASTLAASVAGALTASAEASVQDLIVGAVNSVWSTLFGD